MQIRESFSRETRYAFKQDIAQSRSQGSKAQVMADPWADWKSNDLTSRVNALEKRLSGVESEQKSTREVRRPVEFAAEQL